MSLHWYEAAKRPEHIIDGGYLENKGWVLGFGNDEKQEDVITIKEALYKALEGQQDDWKEFVEVSLTRDEAIDKIVAWLEAKNQSVQTTDIEEAKTLLDTSKIETQK